MTQTTTIHGDQLALFAQRGRRAQEAVDKVLEGYRLPDELVRGADAAGLHHEAREAGELKRIRQLDRARAASKGAETSRAALCSVEISAIEGAVLGELANGPGTAEELGDRLKRVCPELSAWGPQTMSGACNRLLRKRRIFRRDKRKGRSGRLAWIWELRSADTLAV